MTSATTSSPSTDFVPATLDAAKWDNLKPLFESLQSRPLKCEGCLEQLILDRSELDAAASEARARLYIGMTCHTDDAKIKQAYLEFVEKVDPPLKEAGFALDRRIVDSPHADKLDDDRYGVLLRNLRADVEIFREENIPLQTDETKLDQQYSEICGEMTVMFRGEEKTLPQMGRFLEETDRATREEAWRLVADRRFKDREKIDDIYDKLIQLRHRIAQNAGCDSYVEYAFKAMHRFDYTPEDCRAFHDAAEKVCVPVVRKLNAQRAQSLKVDPLRPWDLAVDVKSRAPLRPFEKADELIDGSSRLFHRMEPKLGSMYDTMRDGSSLDLDSRKGKAPGGYMETLDRVRRPFIFMNASGLQRDLETMIHEAGHAFHAMLTRDEPLVYYRHSPIEFAEVASMGMELMALPYVGEFYEDAEADRARRGALEDFVKTIPWVATIDAFQHWIYTHPNHSRAERTEFWLSLDERFGHAVDWSGLDNFRQFQWQRQLHLFGYPFYYIEYGIATLGAMQLWCHARKNEKRALENYKKGLSLGGTRPLPELFQTAGLKFDFGLQTMQSLMAEVDAELKKLPE